MSDSVWKLVAENNAWVWAAVGAGASWAVNVLVIRSKVRKNEAEAAEIMSRTFGTAMSTFVKQIDTLNQQLVKNLSELERLRGEVEEGEKAKRKVRELEAQLTNMQAELQILWNLCPVGIMEFDTTKKGLILRANAAACEFAGLAPGELAGQFPATIWGAEKAAEWVSAAVKAIETASPLVTATVYKRPFTDRKRWVVSYMYPVFDDAGNATTRVLEFRLDFTDTVDQLEQSGLRVNYGQTASDGTD